MTNHTFHTEVLGEELCKAILNDDTDTIERLFKRHLHHYTGMLYVLHKAQETNNDKLLNFYQTYIPDDVPLDCA